MFVTSCASTTKVENTKISYIDLSGKEQVKLIEEYWTVAKKIEPRYPILAAKNNISGCVDLIVGIDQNGKVKGYKVRSSYPKGVFDKSAAAAIANWKWQPTEKNKGNMPVLTSVRMDFSTQRTPTGAKFLENCPKHEA
ncbi:energy transducer TonB [Colwellia sp. RSH04]|nr:energy transducer TonB [Colwellia sp. RSH04]